MEARPTSINTFLWSPTLSMLTKRELKAKNMPKKMSR